MLDIAFDKRHDEMRQGEAFAVSSQANKNFSKKFYKKQTNGKFKNRALLRSNPKCILQFKTAPDLIARILIFKTLPA